MFKILHIPTAKYVFGAWFNRHYVCLESGLSKGILQSILASCEYYFFEDANLILSDPYFAEGSDAEICEEHFEIVEVDDYT